jgi:hypothetical protein
MTMIDFETKRLTQVRGDVSPDKATESIIVKPQQEVEVKAMAQTVKQLCRSFVDQMNAGKRKLIQIPISS